MPSSSIQHALDKALAAPGGERNMARFLATFARRHPDLLRVEEGDRDRCLAAALRHYVALLPLQLAELEQGCHDCGHGMAWLRMQAVLDQFFDAIEPARYDYGLVGILDKVYFGQRLVEELHDRLRLELGRPLLSWDLAMANLLVHTLIGDDYANSLDLAGQEIIDSLPAPQKQQMPPATLAEPPPWPCLISHHGLKLNLS